MPPRTVARLVGVYDADGSVVGELTYFVRSRLGQAHCALCDITHGRVRERADWIACRRALPVPFVTYHRDQRPPAIRAVTSSPGWLPAVLAEVDGTDGVDAVVALLDAAALEACAGAPSRLVEALDAAVDGAGLAWPS